MNNNTDFTSNSLQKQQNSNLAALHPWCVTGFVDGEASFGFILVKNNRMKSGWTVHSVFQIGLHKKDRALLELIQLSFNGVGKIFELSNTCHYQVRPINDLKVVMDHFDKYPLITQKLADFLLFKQGLELIKDKKHLTPSFDPRCLQRGRLTRRVKPVCRTSFLWNEASEHYLRECVAGTKGGAARISKY